MTSTYPPGRFGAIDIQGNQIKSFKEKPKGDGAMINGGFFVLSPKVLNRIPNDGSIWEQEPLMSLAEDGELMAMKVSGNPWIRYAIKLNWKNFGSPERHHGRFGNEKGRCDFLER